ncbi:rhamnan synthesis F family protein [Thalassovita sp.]|uniref:rhamnan synthesis F family protein n=1 Tax=Thalassovita sp. TaxID=1979401 RepID=UPI003B5CC148
MQTESSAYAPFVTDFTFTQIETLCESAWLGHAPFALWLVEALRPLNIVELGTHNGYSFFAFCQAMRDLGLDGQVHAVDTWAGDPQAGFYSDEVYREVAQITASKFPGVGTLHKMTFNEARDSFSAGDVDILHIDGLHTYEAVKHDFETWRETVREGGVVLFHDTQVRRDDFGVWKLWEELSAEYPSFEFFHSHGLGVLGVGRAFPEKLEQLFALSTDSQEAAQVRRQFERLGNLVELQVSNSNLSSELNQTSAKLASNLASRSWRITAPLRFVHANSFRLVRKAKLWLYFRALAIADLPASLFRRRGLFIESIEDGAQSSAPLSKACVFVHFDKDGKIDPHVIHHVKAICDAGFQVIFVSNAPGVTPEEIEKIRPYTWRIILRTNIGYDFGAWKTGIHQIENIAELDCLLLCNDSVYGPLEPLDQVFSKMSQRDHDFWGIVDTSEVSLHVQSFFVCYGKRVLSSPIFQKFWRDLPLYKQKFRVIYKGEIGLSKKLLKAGFRMGALCSYDKISDRAPKRFAEVQTQSGTSFVNPTRYFWDVLIRDMGCPYLKVDLVRDGLATKEGPRGWADVIGEASTFDIQLIQEHAERINADTSYR